MPNDNICEALKDYMDIPVLTTFKAYSLGCLFGLKCGLDNVSTYYSNLSLNDIFNNVLKNLGVTFGQGVIMSIFPPAIAIQVVAFIITNFKEFMDLSGQILNSNKEQLYNNIGKIIGKELLSAISKKKKFK